MNITCGLLRKAFDGYEIAPCAFYAHPNGEDIAESFETAKEAFECAEETGGFVKWTLYGHRDGEGVEAIADFITPYCAGVTLSSILGRPIDISTTGRSIIPVEVPR